MATHSSNLAWRILWMEEPGGLLPIGSHRAVHNWSDLAAAAVWRTLSITLLLLPLLSHFSRVRPCATPWTAAYQAPSPMGFSRQEYWSGVPLPSPLAPQRGIKPTLPTSEGKPLDRHGSPLIFIYLNPYFGIFYRLQTLRKEIIRLSKWIF